MTALLCLGLSTMPVASKPQLPAQAIETLRAPAVVIERVEPVPLAGIRPDRYAVWQYYGVDRAGSFRPRVILTPEGAYYLYNGKCYPWVSTHPLDMSAIR